MALAYGGSGLSAAAGPFRPARIGRGSRVSARVRAPARAPRRFAPAALGSARRSHGAGGGFVRVDGGGRPIGRGGGVRSSPLGGGGLLLVLGVSALILTMSESRPLQRPRLGTGLVILAALAATLLAFWAGEGWMPGHRSIEPLASAVTVGVEICIRLMLLLLFWVLLTPARPPEAEDGGWPFPPR